MGQRGPNRVHVQLSENDPPDPPPPLPSGHGVDSHDRRTEWADVARSRRRALRDPVLVDPLPPEEDEPRVRIFSVDATPVEVHVEAVPAGDEVSERTPGSVATLFEGRYGLVLVAAIVLMVFLVGMAVSRTH